MVTPNHQLQVVLSHPTPSPHVAQQPRPVPAFLKKLYEMINDPENIDLIRWSDSGDSFFGQYAPAFIPYLLYSLPLSLLVLDHERFAREVLGGWFKHQNFATFVRQLNMYGFRKIPHLRQGVLRSDSETEFWNFGRANFHRDQPDLLHLIHRKKANTQQQIKEVAAAGFLPDMNDNTVIAVGAQGAGAGSPNATATAVPPACASGAASTNISALNSSQILDIHSIVQGIAAISAELTELKRSNEMLWQDALLAREKHQQQEDTINRIVKFLAGVFGNYAPPGAGGVGGDEQHGEDENPGRNVSVQRRSGSGGNDGMRRVRLMIEDVRRQKKSVQVMNVAGESEDDEMMNDTIGSGAGREQSTSPVTLGDCCFPPSHSPSILIMIFLFFTALDLDSGLGPTETETETPKSANTPLPTSPAEGSNQKTDAATNPDLLTALTSGRALARTPPVFTGPLSSDNTAFSFDPRNLTINLTPAQIQQLLASVATQTIADPSGNHNGYSGHHGDHYERGLLTAANQDGPKDDDRTFDISSYLVPSPTIANSSIGAVATSPTPPTTTSPVLSNSTPRVDGGNESSARSGVASASGPVLDAANAAASQASDAPASVATTNSRTAGNTNAIPYAGDLSVLPWAAYPPPTIPSTNAGGTTNGAYDFPYNPDATWGNVGSGDYSGLFSPLQASPRTAYSGTTGASGAGVNGGQCKNIDADAVNPSSTSSVGSTGLSTNWQAAEDIDRDVSAMHMSIHSLIQMLGLDPSLMGNTSVDGGEEEEDEEDVREGPTSPRVSGTARRKSNVADYDSFMNSWSGAAAGVVGTNDGGAVNRSLSGSTQTGSSSTPSGASVPSHAGSAAGESPDGDESVIPSATLGLGLGKAALSSESALPSSVAPVSAQSVTSGFVPVDDGAARPIHKKARTGLTASAPTSVGVPITVVEAGGRKRRSVVVDVPASAADELDAVDEGLARAQGATGAAAASRVRTKEVANGATSSKGTKSKRRA